MFPAFHGYGASGKAEGQVVYVNYGSPADFERAARPGDLGRGQDRRSSAMAARSAVSRSRRRRTAAPSASSSTRIRADDGYMQRRRVSGRPDASAVGDPARLGALSVARARRSVDAGLAVDRGCEAAHARADDQRPENPVAADLLRRSGEDPPPSRRPARAGRLAGRTALHVSRRSRLGAVAMDVQMDEGLKPIYNVIATHPRQRRTREERHPRQPSRRVDAWRRGSELGHARRSSKWRGLWRRR